MGNELIGLLVKEAHKGAIMFLFLWIYIVQLFLLQRGYYVTMVDIQCIFHVDVEPGPTFTLWGR